MCLCRPLCWRQGCFIQILTQQLLSTPGSHWEQVLGGKGRNLRGFGWVSSRVTPSGPWALGELHTQPGMCQGGQKDFPPSFHILIYFSAGWLSSGCHGGELIPWDAAAPPACRENQNPNASWGFSAPLQAAFLTLQGSAAPQSMFQWEGNWAGLGFASLEGEADSCPGKPWCKAPPPPCRRKLGWIHVWQSKFWAKGLEKPFPNLAWG